jgi:FkbM family methyltransferase
MSVPTCGKSHERNEEYLKKYSDKKFFSHLVNIPDPIVFDVGAHLGESIDFFTNIYPESRITSFEPNPEAFQELVRKNAKNAIIVQEGLSNSIGSATYYKQTMSHLGGLKKINSDSKDSLGYASNALNQSLEIKINTLDNYCKTNNIDAIDILKIDVQGLEVEVLQGAKEILKNTKVITLELSLYDFYENVESPLLKIEEMMQSSGHGLWDISHVAKNLKNFRTDWAELVYTKKQQ